MILYDNIIHIIIPNEHHLKEIKSQVIILTV